MLCSRDSVDDTDTSEKYSKLLQEHIERFEVLILMSSPREILTLHNR